MTAWGCLSGVLGSSTADGPRGVGVTATGGALVTRAPKAPSRASRAKIYGRVVSGRRRPGRPAPVTGVNGPSPPPLLPAARRDACGRACGTRSARDATKASYRAGWARTVLPATTTSSTGDPARGEPDDERGERPAALGDHRAGERGARLGGGEHGGRVPAPVGGGSRWRPPAPRRARALRAPRTRREAARRVRRAASPRSCAAQTARAASRTRPAAPPSSPSTAPQPPTCTGCRRRGGRPRPNRCRRPARRPCPARPRERAVRRRPRPGAGASKCSSQGGADLGALTGRLAGVRAHGDGGRARARGQRLARPVPPASRRRPPGRAAASRCSGGCDRRPRSSPAQARRCVLVPPTSMPTTSGRGKGSPARILFRRCAVAATAGEPCLEQAKTGCTEELGKPRDGPLTDTAGEYRDIR